MVTGLATLVIVAALIATLWTGAYAAFGRLPDRAVQVGLGAVEALLLVQVVVGAVLLGRGDGPGRGEDIATFLGYLLTSLLVLPAGALWAHSERNRSGTTVLAVACLVIPVLVLREKQVWGAVHG